MATIEGKHDRVIVRVSYLERKRWSMSMKINYLSVVEAAGVELFHSL
jgi:hypothetical protein